MKITEIKDKDITWTKKPDDLKDPSWYFQRLSSGWNIYIGIVFRRLVFTIGTPWFSFGYAFDS